MFRMSSSPSLVRCKRHIALFLFVSLLHLSIVPAQAEVRLPNGEYRTTVTDLRVKTLGGAISIDRTWQATNLNGSKGSESLISDQPRNQWKGSEGIKGVRVEWRLLKLFHII